MGSRGVTPGFARLALAALVILTISAPPASAAEQVLTPAAGAAFDTFGGGSFGLIFAGGPGFALSGDILVGGSRDDLPGQSNQGSATVFRRSGATWVEEQTLTSSSGDANDMFGYSVAACGHVIVVGAPYDDVSFAKQGSATVFRWNGSTWVEEQLLTAVGSQADDRFGTSVSISGDVIAVASYHDDVGGVVDQGSVAVFRWNGSAWVEEQRLIASDGQLYDSFGSSVSVSGDTIAVGSMLDTVGGVQSMGSIRIFRWNGSTWVEGQTLTRTGGQANDEYGAAVSVSGDVLVGGCAFATVGGKLSAGCAIVYRWNGSAWIEEQTITLTGGLAWDYFGSSVAVNGHTLVVGAIYDTVLGHDDRGSATLLRWDGATWIEELFLYSSVGGPYEAFGAAVAVDGDTVAAAAPGHEVNGNPNQGAISVFEIPDGPWSDQGSALAGVYGDPLLVGAGDLSSGSSNMVGLSLAAPSATVGLFLALSSASLPFKGGTLKPFPFFPIVFLATSPTGTLPIPFVMPAGVPPDTELWVQWAVQDAAAIHGVSLSNALRGITP